MITFDDVRVGQLVSSVGSIGQILLKDERAKSIYVEFKEDSSMKPQKLWYPTGAFWMLDLYTGDIPDYPWVLKVPSTLTECKGMSESVGDFSEYEEALMLPITEYIWRHKDNRLEDLKKARDFLDLLIEWEEELVKGKKKGVSL